MNHSQACFTEKHRVPAAIDSPLYQRGAGGDFSKLGARATVAKSPSFPLWERGRPLPQALSRLSAVDNLSMGDWQ